MSRPLRSILFVPGTHEDRFTRAIASGADAVVFDLEDSVEASSKNAARQAIGGYFGSASDLAPLPLVRINPVGSRWVNDDLAFAGALRGLGGVVLPKTETVEQLRIVAEVMGAARVYPLLETARGVLNALALADAMADIPALLFGAEDLTAEIGTRRTTDGEELLFARSQVVLAATAAAADAIDAVFTDVADADGLKRDATRARALGFRGKMIIHPDQVAVVNDVFTPSKTEIEHANRIVSADATAQVGVFRLGNEMIDRPVVARAERILELAKRLGRS
jgi:citrate lyase subunit beta/citryl-CoA lyase